jgi:hypothetical protein
MGVVYRAHDRETDTDVALKTLAVHDPGELYRLKNEFRSLAGVVHRNLVELYELFVKERECFFTMELVDGVDFIEYVRSDANGVDYERLTDVLRQLVSGLAALHAVGKLHRDVKPSNVLVTRAGRVVVLDFGLVTVFGGTRAGDTQPGLVGTLTYMAPEQAWGMEPDPAADWYSVGVMLYEALTGRVPFAGPAAQMLADKGRGKPPAPRTLRPDVPEDLDALTMALLDPAPAGRPGPKDILAKLQERSGAARQTQQAQRVGGDAEDVTFVGRVEELAELRRAFESVSSRQPNVVLVEGPSGIGKSELVRQFLATVESGGRTVVLDGRCHPHEAVPYKALDGLVDRLSRFLMTLPEAGVAALVPRHTAAVTRLFPVLARVPALASWQDGEDAAEPYELRRRGFAALRELLARIGDRQPLVLWIDDLQWGDADSAALLRELLRPPDPPVMLLVLSYRGEDRESAPLADTLKMVSSDLPDEALRRIVLSPLSPTETHDLAARLCNTPADNQIAAIATEANGSPFLVTQLARYAALRSPTEDEAARPTGLHLQTLLAERIEHLGASAQEILELVSIAGRPLDRSVALEAAGIGERGRPFIARLEHEGLLRTAPHDTQPTVEMYHDRIREVIAAQLPPQRLRTRHRQLAETIERQPSPDPDALFRHFLGADERERAGEWAVRAADRAADTLAFVEAAELYGQALQLKQWDSEPGTKLQIRRADALVNAGRGAEAAPLFLAAATRNGNPQALDLRRRAAEQYLVSGHMEEGTAVVRRLMEEIGVGYPKTSSRAALGTLVRVVPIWLGGGVTRSRRPAQFSAAHVQRIDTCYSAAKGLVLVDPMRGLYFAVLTLALALRSGDQLRAARSLAAVGAALIPLGGPMGKWATKLLHRAREIAQATRDPYLLGFTAVTSAQICMMEGRWRQMLCLCNDGSDILRRHCRGVAWELDIACMAALRAMEELGELSEMYRRADQLMREAEDRGDLYGVAQGLLFQGLHRLAVNDPAGVRSLATRIVELWTFGEFDMLQFYIFRLEAYADICDGQPLDSWQRVQDNWPELKRSNLLRHSLLRVDAHLLRARSALAVACADNGSRDEMLSAAEADAALVARKGNVVANAHALLVRAGIVAARGDGAAAVGLLKPAMAAFEAADMALCAALAQRRAGALIGGAEGGELVSAATKFFSREGIPDPASLLAMYAPGFAGTDTRAYGRAHGTLT